MSHNYTVYLAGSITGQSYVGATHWRKLVAGDPNWGNEVKFLSPMRDYDFLENELNIGGAYPGQFMCDSKSIFFRDYNDVVRSDLVLAYAESADISIGTLIEITWAHSADIPAVLVSSNPKYRHHPLLQNMCLICETLEEGARTAQSILAVGEKYENNG